MASKPTEPRTIAVVSAYRAPDDLLSRSRTLLDQVDRVVIVDDGTHSTAQLGPAGPGIEIEELPENRGIAAALNVGIRRALDLGATHILTLDQDSTIDPGFVADGLALLAAKERDGVATAAVVPATFGGTAVVTARDGVRPLDPIQSGQIIPRHTFETVGLFDERLFIDSVDTEFTLRARSRGYEFFIVPGSVLHHSLGEVVPVLLFGRHISIFGRPRNLSYHAPFRTYYIVRNGLGLWRLHRRGNVLWLVRRTGAMFYSTLVSVLLADDRRYQIHATAFGVRDSIRARWGRIPESARRRVSPQP